MEQYQVTLTGKTALLHHWDNIEWADKLDAWKNDPASRKESKAGDDRTPAWRWIGSLYNDATVVTVPSDNLMRCLMEGGAMVPVPGGRSGKTFKSQTQSGMMVNEMHWPLAVSGGRSVAMSSIVPLLGEKDFAAHKAAAQDMGFRLHVKRAKIGASKHIRVRPVFDQWSLAGTISVWDPQLTQSVLLDILTYAGTYKGLGDWRPGGKTPGSFGMFTATLKKI